MNGKQSISDRTHTIARLRAMVWRALPGLFLVLGILVVAGCGNDPTEPVDRTTVPSLEGDRINSFYTNEEIAYLLEIGLNHDTMFAEPYVSRWIVPQVISLAGRPTEQDLLTLNDVVSDLNALTPEIPIVIDSVRPNVEIFFITRAAFSALFPDYPYPAYSHTNLSLTFGQQASILIATDSTTQSERDSYLRRELARSLGLLNTSSKYPNSIFYADWSPGESLPYSYLDRTIIRMLYSSRFSAHMTRDDVIRRMANR